MLYRLLSATDRDEFRPGVMSLLEPGRTAEKIGALGIEVMTLGLRRAVPSPLVIPRLGRLMAQWQPDVIQTWMYHADLLGGIAARMYASAPVLWNVRASRLDVEGISRRTRWIIAACANLSRWLPSRIVCGSHAAAVEHVRLGYPADRIVEIPNGFDLEQYCADHTARTSLLRELNLEQAVRLVGLVARFDPLKDHRTFIRAAALTARSCESVHFVLCGDAVDKRNMELMNMVNETGLSNRFHLLGRRHDIPRVTAALDVACLSSYSEGLPNSVGEAMSCGVPCVVTDVGDAARVVGDCGVVVPPRDWEALAEGVLKLLRLPPGDRAELGARARRRIEAHYSLTRVVRLYEDLYRAVVRNDPASSDS